MSEDADGRDDGEQTRRFDGSRRNHDFVNQFRSEIKNLQRVHAPPFLERRPHALWRERHVDVADTVCTP